jgi:nucleoside-diphosphate-sugar epimerase
MGSKSYSNRVNGLVDKLINALDTDQVIEIFANLKTKVDLIHIDDFVDLLIKAVETELIVCMKFLVGRQNIVSVI